MDTLPITTPRQAGIYVRQARETQGLTRAALAKKAGVSERLLASLELGDATGIRLDKLLAVFGAEREVLIAREITKLHEQIVSMALADSVAWFAADSNRSRGEFVLVVAGKQADAGLEAEAERVLALLLGELPLKSAARLAAEITGASKNALYARALELREGGG